MKITKIFFQIINILFLILYLYPGSIIGFVVYKDFSKQPQVTPDFIFSSNHVYAFLALSLLGFISYIEKKKLIIFYFLFLSIILELINHYCCYLYHPNFDLFCNILGVLISIIILKIYIYLEKK